MSTGNQEARAIARGMGRWSDPAFPKSGWRCTGVIDLGQPTLQCGACQGTRIRYAHRLSHVDWPDTLSAGCICAGHLTGDPAAASERDSVARSRASRRSRWLSRNWKRSAKGNDTLKIDGWYVTIFTASSGGFGASVARQGGSPHFLQMRASTRDEAKLAAFDLFEQLNQGDTEAPRRASRRPLAMSQRDGWMVGAFKGIVRAIGR